MPKPGTISAKATEVPPAPGAAGLRRRLGTWDLVLFGIGAIVGAGIFSTLGTAAAGDLATGRPAAGPALLVSILLVAAACAITGLAYAELAALMPVAGSAYAYARAALGEVVGWLIGWNLLLEYAVSNVAVAISWAGYARDALVHLLGLPVPAWLAMDPGSALALANGAAPMDLPARLRALAAAKQGLADGAALFRNWDTVRAAPTVAGFPVAINLLAVLVTILVTWLAVTGIRQSARTNHALVLVKVALLVAVVAIGLGFVDPANWVPFAPRGWPGIQAGAAIIFFAFIGFDAISTTAEECRDPARTLPRGILLSLAVCTLLYLAVALVVTGMVPWRDLAGRADPLAYVFARHDFRLWSGFLAVGAVAATTAALLVYQVGLPRILMAMSRDGLLGPWFGRIHPKHGTPANATLLTGALVALPAACLDIDEAVALTNIGTLVAFATVCGAVLVLRVRRPEAARRFRMPWAWALAPLGMAACGWLALGLPAVTWVRFLLWLVLGAAVYLLYGRRRRTRRGSAT